MPGGNYINIKISIRKDNICFTKDENSAPPSPFSLDDDDSSSNNIRVELGIAKVFHKVLNLIKTESRLFQKEDFELLGEMLARILFGKVNQMDIRNYVMTEVEQILEISNPSATRICRIFLEFDEKSGVAMLPWEYTLYKTRTSADGRAIYLAANSRSRFHLIRRVKQNPLPDPAADKLFMIVLVNVDGNPDAVPPIDSRMSELPKIRQVIGDLQRKFPDSLIIEYLENTTFDRIGREVEEVYRKWVRDYGQEPCYALHYLGHAILEDQIGKLVIRDEVTGNPEWIEDKQFAAVFSDNVLDVRPPVMVSFQACDSAKIGNFEEKLRGVAYEFTNINIPAVIGMQNEIDTAFSNAFFSQFYDGILSGKDVAEAITSGRDYLGRKFRVRGDGYSNNSFGSPVLFITTEEPVRIVKAAGEKIPETDRKTLDDSSASGAVAMNKFAAERQREPAPRGEPGTSAAGAAVESQRPPGIQRPADATDKTNPPAAPLSDSATPSQPGNPPGI
jgi:hypothetical protein